MTCADGFAASGYKYTTKETAREWAGVRDTGSSPLLNVSSAPRLRPRSYARSIPAYEPVLSKALPGHNLIAPKSRDQVWFRAYHQKAGWQTLHQPGLLLLSPPSISTATPANLGPSATP